MPPYRKNEAGVAQLDAYLEDTTKNWGQTDTQGCGQSCPKTKITAAWQKAVCKLYEIQCSIHDKYVTKKKEKWFSFSFLQKIKTHYQIFEKIKKRSLVKL